MIFVHLVTAGYLVPAPETNIAPEINGFLPFVDECSVPCSGVCHCVNISFWNGLFMFFLMGRSIHLVVPIIQNSQLRASIK